MPLFRYFEKFSESETCLIFIGPLESFCDVLVGYVPTVIDMIENQQNVSNVCIELKFCDKPLPRYDDPVSVPRYSMYAHSYFLQFYQQAHCEISYILIMLAISTFPQHNDFKEYVQFLNSKRWQIF